MIFYVDGPATVRRPELLRVAWSLLVAQREEYRAYVFDSAVYRIDQKSVRAFEVRDTQSLVPEAIDHAQTTHPSAKRYVVLTDNKYERDAGPQTSHPDRWIWFSTKIIRDRRCERSGNWIACDVSTVAKQQAMLGSFRQLART